MSVVIFIALCGLFQSSQKVESELMADNDPISVIPIPNTLGTQPGPVIITTPLPDGQQQENI